MIRLLSSVLSLRTLGIAAGLLLLAGMARPMVGHAQPDSVRTALLKAKGFPPDHSPRKALWRAAAVPGWGQLYNRQYYKIPFVYAGLGGLGVFIYRSNQSYLLFRRAALYKQDMDANSQFASEFTDAADELTGCASTNQCDSVSDRINAGQLRNKRDKFRRRRDLAIVGTGVFYALSLVDAYVSAHLLTFDVDENLSLTVAPAGLRTSPAIGASKPSAAKVLSAPSREWGLRFRLRF